MDYKSDLNLDLVDLDHPGLESLVFKRVPLEDLQTRRELGIALIAEQPAQVAEKEPCGDSRCYLEGPKYNSVGFSLIPNVKPI